MGEGWGLRGQGNLNLKVVMSVVGFFGVFCVCVCVCVFVWFFCVCVCVCVFSQTAALHAGDCNVCTIRL